MNRKYLTAAIFTLITGAANAGVIQSTDTFALTEADFYNQTLTFDLFDDLGGTRELTSVKFLLTGDVSGTAKIENMSAGGGAEIDATLSSMITLATLSGDNLVSVLPSVLREFSAASFDGTFDYLGTSGATFDSLIAQKTASASYSEQSFLDSFTGAGTINTHLSAIATSRVSGGGNTTSSFGTFAGATATITYTFAEIDQPENSVSVPVPATALLFGSALFGFGMTKRKSKV